MTEKNKRVKGVYLERVEPTVMRHSTLGEFAGGYFPAMYEYRDGFNVGSETTLAAEKHARGYANKMFKASHNEPRNEAVYGEKIRLNLDSRNYGSFYHYSIEKSKSRGKNSF